MGYVMNSRFKNRFGTLICSDHDFWDTTSMVQQGAGIVFIYIKLVGFATRCWIQRACPGRGIDRS
jgi:hypothetical protein